MATPRRVGSGRVPHWKLRRWVPAVLWAAVGGGAALAQPPAPFTPPPATAPAAPAAVQPATPAAPEKLYSYRFSNQPWNQVFDWFERESGLRILTADVAQGSVTMTVDKKTLPQVIDLMNEVLGQQNRILVRGNQTFTIFPADKGVPGDFVKQIEVADLPKYGQTEFVRVRIPLQSGLAADVVPQLEKVKSPFGVIVAIGQDIIITDKVATVRGIERLLNPVETRDKDSFNHACKFVGAIDVAEKLRSLLADSTTNVNANPQQQQQQQQQQQPQPGRAPGAAPDSRFRSVQVAIVEQTNSVFVTGPADKIAVAKGIVKELDVGTEGQKPRIIGGQPTAVSYPVPTGTADTIARVLTKRYQLSSLTSIQAQGTDQILVIALPADHIDIGATLKGEQKPDIVSQFVAITQIDIAKAATTLTNTLGSATGSGTGLFVEARADAATPGILLRGTPRQIKEAIDILRSLGEPIAGGVAGEGPAKSVYGPNTSSITIEKGNAGALAEGIADLVRKLRPKAKVEVTVPGRPAAEPKPAKSKPAEPVPTPGSGDQSAAPRRLDPNLVLAQAPGQPKPPELSIVVLGNRIIFSSDDPETLNLVTQLARSVVYGGTGEDINEVIRIKYVSAKAAADVLNEVFNGTAANAPAQQGGGGRRGFSPLDLFGGFGGGSSAPSNPSSGRIRIVAEQGSNSLIVVKASPADLILIKDLLKNVIDDGRPPEGGVQNQYIVALKNAAAEDVKDALIELFPNQAAKSTSGSSSRGQGFPFFGGGGQPQQAPAAVELAIVADVASNQLLINATEALYGKVKTVIDTLDRSTGEKAGVVRVLKVQGLSPTQVKEAVEALVGKPAAQEDSYGGYNPYSYYGGYGYSSGRSTRGSGRNSRSSSRSRSSLDGPRLGTWPSPGGPDFFADRGKDAPSAATLARMITDRSIDAPIGDVRTATLIHDPEQVAPAWVRTESTPTVKFATVNLKDHVPQATPVVRAGAMVQAPPAPGQPGEPKGTVAKEIVVTPPAAGSVEVTPLDNDGVVIIRAPNQETIDNIIKFLALLKRETTESEIIIKTFKLEKSDASEITQTLIKFFERVEIQGDVIRIVDAPEPQYGGFLTGLQDPTAKTVGSLVLFPVPRFNTIIVATTKSRMPDIEKQIKEFDQPNSGQLKPVAYSLKRASATVVKTQLQNFFIARYPGGGGSSLTTFTVNVSGNSLLVQAAPGDQEEIAELIRILDTETSQAVNEFKVIRLRNAFAGEVATVIQRALSVSVVNPNQSNSGSANLSGGAGGQGNQVLGGFGPVAVGGGGRQNQNQDNNNQNQQQNQNQQGQLGGATGSLTGITTKTTALQFMSTNGKGGAPVLSGALEDVHIVPVERVNGLLIAAPTQTMKLLEAVIAELDVAAAAQSNVNVFTLVKSDATQVALLLRQLFTTQQGGAANQLGNQFGGNQQGGNLNQQGGNQNLGQQGAAGATGTSRPLLTLTGGTPSEGANLIGLNIAPDTRTNSIIVAGSLTDLQTINAIIARLESADAPTVVPQVYKLRNAAAADVALAVTTFVNQQFQLATSIPGGATFATLQRNLVVVGEPVSNTLLISAVPGLSNDIGRLIAQLDATPPQVLVKVLIAEVTLTNREEFGVELGIQSPVLFARSRVGSATNVAGEPGFNFNTTAPLPNGEFLPGTVGFQGLGNLGVGRAGASGVGGLVFSAASDTVSVLIRALKTQTRVDVLSEPQLVLTDNQQGFFQVGQSFPYVTASNATLGVAQQSIEYRDLGVVLRVVPRISPEGRVLMRVEPQVSSVGALVTLGGGVVSPSFNVQSLQTTVNAGDGETVILGGLITKSDSKTENKIPVLGDIPYIGAAFRYRTQDVSRRELLFILTPHIIRNELDFQRLTCAETARMSWNADNAIATHGYGADVLSCKPGAVCDPRTNPNLGGAVAFPYHSPALEPAAMTPNVVGPFGVVVPGDQPAPALMPPAGVVMPQPAPVPGAAPQASNQPAGFPLVNKLGQPTVFAPPAGPNAGGTTPPTAPAPTPTEGKPASWNTLGK